jgi:ABC-type transport system involved in cytochrome c biogenesis permease subunit
MHLRRPDSNPVGRLGTGLTLAGLVALTGALVVRGLRAGHWPMASTYEFTLCFALGVGLAWLGLQGWTGERAGGAFALPIALGLLAYGLSMSPQARQVRPLVPALESIWFQVHVSASVVAYGAFAVATSGGVMYLWRRQTANPGPRDGRLQGAERLMWRGVAVGFPLMTAAILAGAIWAQLAWGRYWGWDLKEVWALLIWLVYLVFLHARAVRGWHGRPLALLTLVGFLVVLFTFLGTGWLARQVGLESLHVF